MHINHNRRIFTLFFVSSPNIVTVLIISVNVCLSSSTHKHISPSAPFNETNKEPKTNLREPLEKENIFNVSFDDMLDNFPQLNVNESDITNATNELRPFSALSAFHEDVDPHFVALINPFWLKFNPAPANAHYTLGTIHLVIMTIGLIGNILVIFMFCRCRSLRTPCNKLIFNLAISDFIMLAKVPVVIYNSFKLGPALGEIVCRIYGFLGGLTGTASIATLTAISIDRYNIVVYPMEPLRSTTHRRCNIMVIVVWCYSITFSIVPALNIGFSKYVPEGYLTSCSFDYLDKTTKARIFMFTFFIFAWFIPFCIITFCYVHILRVVISARHIRSSLDKHKTDIKLSVVVISVISLWFVAWTPYAIVALLGISGNEDKISPLGSMIPAVFCKASACINPYVYSISHPRFRKEFGRLFLGRSDTSRRITSMKTSYYVCNKSLNMSTKRKSITNDSNSVNNITFPKNKIKRQKLSLKSVVECETNFSSKIQEFDK